MPRFLLRDAPHSGRAELRGAELRHLRSVLRLGVGDRVELFDGAGGAWIAEVRALRAAAAELAILAEARRDTESPLAVTLAVALAKGAKLDWVVEKATELGVARIVPYASARTVPDPAGGRVERWRRIAAAAARQSGRMRRPDVDAPVTFAEVLRDGARHDVSLLFREDAADEVPPPPVEARAVLAVTGPEGGFAADEAEAAAAAGFRSARLGPRILRAETAAIVAVAWCQLRWGDLALDS